MLGRSTLIHVCIKSLAESLFSFHTRPPNSTGGPEVLVGSTRPRHFRILSHGHGRPRFGHGRGVIEKGFLFRGPVLAGSTTRWGVPSLLGRRIHGTFNPSVFRYQKESCLLPHVHVPSCPGLPRRTGPLLCARGTITGQRRGSQQSPQVGRLASHGVLRRIVESRVAGIRSRTTVDLRCSLAH